MPLTPEEKAELLALIQQEKSGDARENTIFHKSGPGSEYSPEATDLYGSAGGRVKAGFGNLKGLAQELAKQGFTDAKQSNGEIIAKGPDGKWYRDASRFFDSPINWAESAVGKALPFAGSVAGGVMGSASGPGAIAAAGAGGSLGELGRQTIGEKLGVYDADLGESLTDIALEGGIGAAGEGVGLGLAKVLSKMGVGRAVPRGTTQGAIEGEMRVVAPGGSEITDFAKAMPVESKIRPDAEAVRAAAKELPGAPGVPDWALSNNRQTLDIASTALRSPSIGGAIVRREVKPLTDSLSKTATELVSEAASDATPFQAGEGLKKGILDEFRGKIAPAVDTYEGLQPVLENVPIETTGFSRRVKALLNDPMVKANREAKNYVQQLAKDFEGIETVADLKAFRTSIGDAAREKGGGVQYAAGQLYDALTNERDRSIFKSALEKVPKGKSILKAARENEVVKSLRDADKQFAGAIEETSEALGIKRKKYGVERTVEDFVEGIKSENMPEWLFSSRDVAKAQRIKSAFPKQYETARRQELARIMQDATVRGEVNPQRLATALSKYSPEARAMLLGDKASLGEAFSKVQGTIPFEINPSGTAVRGEIVDYLNPRKQIPSLRYPIQLRMNGTPSAFSGGTSKIGAMIQKNPELINTFSNPSFREALKRYVGNTSETPISEEEKDLKGKQHFLDNN